MNRAEFMRQLRLKLFRLPQEEIESAIEYYEEYFEEAGIENEQIVLQKLGSPEETASKILQDFADKKIQNSSITPSAKKGISALWFAILAVFSAPITLPLTIFFITILIGLGLAVFICALVFFATGLLLLGIGFFSGWIGLCIFAQHIPTAIAFIGIAFSSAGIGLLLLLVMSIVIGKGCMLCASSISRKLKKRRKAL